MRQPTGVALRQEGLWTYWHAGEPHLVISLALAAGADVNATFVEPFVNYTTAGATSFYLNTETTYDWTSDKFSVPINAGVNQMLKIGGGLR